HGVIPTTPSTPLWMKNSATAVATLMPKPRNKVAKAFGRALREARDWRGLTQEELAADAELDRTYPSLLERGKRTPTLTVVYVLAKVLRTSMTKLSARTEEELEKIEAAAIAAKAQAEAQAETQTEASLGNHVSHCIQHDHASIPEQMDAG